ncbi:Nramp family divalent metal transporter [Pseudonocardia sp. ICBG601]|uniref:Nramp family divalent metal transporter n=1 Tax=Pseudonocardia sp. ICBG601 TaxID=2846759 RepID=UPI0035AC2297
MMRLDNATGYIMTGIFVVSMLVVGSTILLGENLTESDSGLLTLADRLGALYGEPVRILFLVGFLSVTFTSLLGVWNGVSLLFTDWVRAIRLPHGKKAAIGPDEVNAVVPGEEATAERGDGPGRPGPTRRPAPSARCPSAGTCCG